MKRNYNKTKGIQQLRLLYGLSQQQLADYLSINIGTLAMAETGRRTLSAAALIKLNGLDKDRLRKLPAAAQKNLELVLKETFVPVKATLRQRVAACRYRAEVYKKELANAAIKYRQAINRLQLTATLSSSLPKSNEAKKDAKWMEVVEMEAKKMTRKYSEAMQATLQIKIDCLEYEIMLTEKWLKV